MEVSFGILSNQFFLLLNICMELFLEKYDCSITVWCPRLSNTRHCHRLYRVCHFHGRYSVVPVITV